MFRSKEEPNKDRIILIPKSVPAPTLRLSHFSLLKDLGISSLHLYKNGYRLTNRSFRENLHKELKELVKGMRATDNVKEEEKLQQRVSNILDKHGVMGFFHYPTIRIKSQQRKLLNHTKEKQVKIDNKILLLKNNKLGGKLKDKQQTEKKFRQEKQMIDKQIKNRESMLQILDTLGDNDSLKVFMRDINYRLTQEQQKLLVVLTKETERLAEAKIKSKPFELMFVYDPSII